MKGASTVAAGFPHAPLTAAAVTYTAPTATWKPAVDFVFLLGLVLLYAVTRWLIAASARLGGLE